MSREFALNFPVFCLIKERKARYEISHVKRLFIACNTCRKVSTLNILYMYY